MKPVILCIDDEQIILNVLNLQLKRKFGGDFRYEFAESAEEGMEIIDEVVRDGDDVVMVISDQIMPGMSGDQFLVNVHRRNPKPIKVLLTGQAAVESAINAINNANLYRYITKPWEEEDFLLTIQKGLDQYDLYNKLESKNHELTDLLDVFKRFVPDQLQQRVAKDGIGKINIGSAEEERGTILFSDIRSFARYAEELTPTDTLGFLNALMSPMIPIIHRHYGFIHQFVGDAIMAMFFEAESSDADHAVAAAIEMQQRVLDFNTEHETSVRVGIGLNSGRIITGTIGDKSRLEAAVIGDAVNVASRMENLTKYYGVNILCTNHVVRHLQDPQRYAIRPVDHALVSGKSEPVQLFEIFDADPMDKQETKRGMMDAYLEAQAQYQQRNWQAARAAFLACQRLAPWDKVLDLYIERCDIYLLQPPPADWDGVVRVEKLN